MANKTTAFFLRGLHGSVRRFKDPPRHSTLQSASFVKYGIYAAVTAYAIYTDPLNNNRKRRISTEIRPEIPIFTSFFRKIILIL